MRLVKSKEELKSIVAALKAEGKTVGFVPTMGALHKGHISLIKKSDELSDATIVSVFVNPTQFNNKEDLEKYPRTIENDLKLIESETACRIVFSPSVEEMYEKEEALLDLDLKNLDKPMEGACRPGHFQGVVTVVDKLFKIVSPDKAFFGEKDFQQLAIIQHLQRELHPNLQIVPCPIVRENSGLAMSSRNERLKPEDKVKASEIYQIMTDFVSNIQTKSVEELIQIATKEFESKKYFNLEYINLVDSLSLEPVKSITQHKNVNLCVAVFLAGVRLIDTIPVTLN